MTDEIQQSSIEHHPESPDMESDTPPLPPQKSRKTLWIIVGVIATILCICSLICIALVISGTAKVMKEKAPVADVIDSFMKAVLDKDTEKAFALYSPRAQRQMAVSDLDIFTEGNNFVLIEGYQSIEIINLNIRKAVNTNPDMPQGTIAEVSGTIAYENDFTGTFEAILEKVDGNWFLHYINITVPPEKFSP